MVTSRIFKKLIYLNENYLIYGGFGISKTVSIILLVHLSALVHKFLYEASLPENAQQREELAKLKDHIFTALPRFWYWSFDSEEARIQTFPLSKIILEQATELPQHVKNKLKGCSIAELKGEFNKIYQYETQHRVIIDQTNELVSQAR
jgi:hypothetical protein